MNEYGTAGMLVFFLVSLPLAGWLGAVLTRDGRPLGIFVDRYFRVLVLGLLVVIMALRQAGKGQDWPWVKGVELASFYLLAMLFMPMLRRLQSRKRSR